MMTRKTICYGTGALVAAAATATTMFLVGTGMPLLPGDGVADAALLGMACFLLGGIVGLLSFCAAATVATGVFRLVDLKNGQAFWAADHASRDVLVMGGIGLFLFLMPLVGYMVG